MTSGNFMAIEVSSEDPKELLSKAISELQGKVQYADGLYEKVDGVQIYKDKIEERVSTPAAGNGIVLRAYKRGQWREMSTFDCSISSVREISRKLAEFHPLNKNAAKLEELKPWHIDTTL